MEAGVSHRPLLLILALVLLLRAPFLNQAIQGDDTLYLSEASHALIDPLHPDHTHYVFRGAPVDLRGLSHPPGNAWILAGLLTVFGDVKEVPFHAAYVLFSLMAAAAVWSFARKFSPQPVWAALLFLAVPTFVVNGGSLETDVPFTAFWLAAIALFAADRLFWSALAMVAAALLAYQAVFLTPILAVYCWLFCRRSRVRWLAIFIAPLTVAAWQIFEGLTTGAAPVSVMTGYFRHYGFQAFANKIVNALALSIHFWFLIFPALVPLMLLFAWRGRRDPKTQFLIAWIAWFFGGAVAVCFIGSARYLLPIAAPVALIASRIRVRWLAAGFALQMILSLGLAGMNYQQWGAIRAYAETLAPSIRNHRVWVDDEWGLRHYLQQQGAHPLTTTQQLHPDDIVVAGQLSHAVTLTDPTVPVTPAVEVKPSIPLRIIGLETNSGYSAAALGRLWPFGMSTGVVDRLTAVRILERHPTLESLDLTKPGSKEQVVSGIWPDDRWMSNSGMVVLKSPAAAAVLSVAFYIPDQAPARRVTLSLDGREVAARTVTPGPGELATPGPVKPAGATAMVTIQVDKTFTAPGDARRLGMVVTAIGFR